MIAAKEPRLSPLWWPSVAAAPLSRSGDYLTWSAVRSAGAQLLCSVVTRVGATNRQTDAPWERPLCKHSRPVREAAIEWHLQTSSPLKKKWIKKNKYTNKHILHPLPLQSNRIWCLCCSHIKKCIAFKFLWLCIIVTVLLCLFLKVQCVKTLKHSWYWGPLSGGIPEYGG